MGLLHPIAWLRRHETTADALLASFVTVVSVVVHLADPETDVVVRDPQWWTVPFVIGATLPVAWRRTAPTVTVFVVVGFQIASELLDIGGSGFVGVVIALYSLGAHTVGARRAKVLVAIAVPLLMLLVVGVFLDEIDIGSLIGSIFVLTTAFVLGDNLRRRREHADGLVERAEQTVREQELIAHQQIAAERTRIARELHDVVAHSVSVMVIQAAAARRSLTTSPANAEAALAAIEDTGRQTMNELRSILGVLRSNTETGPGAGSGDAGASTPRSPQPTLADLDALLDAGSDLPIRLRVDDDLDDLAQSVTLTAYRVLQESLTNVRRHAGPVRCVDVAVRRDGQDLDISVTDDGRGAAAAHSGPGYGLVGMAERVAAVGGTLRAEPQTGGGWRVHARIPLDGHRSHSRTLESVAPTITPPTSTPPTGTPPTGISSSDTAPVRPVIR